MPEQETKIIHVGEAIQSTVGARGYRIGAIVRASRDSQLYVVTAAHISASPSDADVTTSGGVTLRRSPWRATTPSIGEFQTISRALTLLKVPGDSVVRPNATIGDSLGPLAPRDLLGAGVRLEGAEQITGTVVAIEAPLWLRCDGDDPIAFFGGLEVRNATTHNQFATSKDAGTAVRTAGGNLVGFVVAADSDGCVVAPAATLFDELELELATVAQIAVHNAEAERSHREARRIESSSLAVGLLVIHSFAGRMSSNSAVYERTAGTCNA